MSTREISDVGTPNRADGVAAAQREWLDIGCPKNDAEQAQRMTGLERDAEIRGQLLHAPHCRIHLRIMFPSGTGGLGRVAGSVVDYAAVANPSSNHSSTLRLAWSARC